MDLLLQVIRDLPGSIEYLRARPRCRKAEGPETAALLRKIQQNQQIHSTSQS